MTFNDNSKTIDSSINIRTEIINTKSQISITDLLLNMLNIDLLLVSFMLLHSF